MLRLNLTQLQNAYYAMGTIIDFYAYEDGPDLEQLEDAKNELKELGIEYAE